MVADVVIDLFRNLSTFLWGLISRKTQTLSWSEKLILLLFIRPHFSLNMFLVPTGLFSHDLCVQVYKGEKGRVLKVSTGAQLSLKLSS